MRKFFAAVGAAALLSLGGLATATAASANPLPSVSAVTSVSNHPDTTNATGPGCFASPNGPAWALDTYTSTMTAVNTSGNDWTVSINDSGTFAGVADPANCAYGVSHGSFVGTYTVFVVSPTAPVAADLHASYNGGGTANSTTQMVKDFFNGAATAVNGGDYDFSYQGGNYVQSSTDGQGTITGDVTLDACTVTITTVPDQSNILGDNVSLQVKATTNEATPPSSFTYFAANLPHSLHINQTTGLISGSITGPTGVSLVTLKVYNNAFSNEDHQCFGTATFKWTVTLTAPPTPTPTPTPTGTPGTTGGGNVPTGAPATGGGTLPAGNPTGQVVGIVILCVGLVLTVGYTLRKVTRNR